MNTETKLEPYVSPEAAAEFLGITRDWLLKLARSGEIPAYALPLGNGLRKEWRFRLSELDGFAQKHRKGAINVPHPPAPQPKERRVV